MVRRRLATVLVGSFLLASIAMPVAGEVRRPDGDVSVQADHMSFAESWSFASVWSWVRSIVLPEKGQIVP